MKKKILNMKLSTFILIMGLAFVLGGCADEVYITRPDHTPPSKPKGFYSITADKAIHLFWEENDEFDFKEYWIYRRIDKGEDYYHRIAVTGKAEYVDQNVENGITYWYAISAVDRNGNESELSRDIHDTPRPDGSAGMYDRFYEPSLSGFDFSGREVVPWDASQTDIYLEYDTNLETFFLCVADTLTDIQDFGYTDTLDDIDWSPLEGWSKIGWVEVILGHSYIVWTWNDHYAKLRVNKIVGDTKILFDWAYQIDPGNQELISRPSRAENYLRQVTKKD